MHKLSRSNRDKLQQFVAITGASEKSALQALKASDWHLEAAFDVFYSQPQPRSNADVRRLEELYNRYKDPYSDMILADGISVLCNDLEVEPQDIVTLVLSWHMNAATACEFSKQEFIGGLQSLGVDSIGKLQEKLSFMRSELKDEQKFHDIYNFAFGWAKEKGQKSLALDTAIGMWQLLFAEREWPLVNHWCDFLQDRHNKAYLRTHGHSSWNLLGRWTLFCRITTQKEHGLTSSMNSLSICLTRVSLKSDQPTRRSHQLYFSVFLFFFSHYFNRLASLTNFFCVSCQNLEIDY